MDDIDFKTEDQILQDNIRRAVLEGKKCPSCFGVLIDKGSAQRILKGGTSVTIDAKLCLNCGTRFAFTKNTAWCDRWEHQQIDILACRKCDIYQYYMKHKRVDLCLEERKLVGDVSCKEIKCTDCEDYKAFAECPFYGGRVGEIIRKA